MRVFLSLKKEYIKESLSMEKQTDKVLLKTFKIEAYLKGFGKKGK
jgi:hypothetical protein